MKTDRRGLPQSGQLFSDIGGRSSPDDELRGEIRKGRRLLFRIVPIPSMRVGIFSSMVFLLSLFAGQPALDEAFVVLGPALGIGHEPGRHPPDLGGEVLIGIRGGKGAPEFAIVDQGGKEGVTVRDG